MKIAVFSDVHSNLEAYRATLENIAERGDIDALWCLGDVVGYGAEPESCLRLTAALAGGEAFSCDDEFAAAVGPLAGKLRHVVLGNHDAAAFGDRIINYFNDDARRAARWTAEEISPAARLQLQNYPVTAVDGDAFLVHATPVKPREFRYVTTLADVREACEATAARVIFCGHTHKPVVVANRGAVAVPPADFGVGEKCLVNVGSVGQPRDGDPRACYVVYDAAERRLEFVRVRYDVEAAAAKIRKAGLPIRLAERLFQGW